MTEAQWCHFLLEQNIGLSIKLWKCGPINKVALLTKISVLMTARDKTLLWWVLLSVRKRHS